jgi:hypothetical protein
MKSKVMKTTVRASRVLVVLFGLLINILNVQAETGKQPASKKEPLISVYPQPSTGLIHLAFQRPLSETPQVMVFDVLGNPLPHIQCERMSATVFSINLTGEKSGYYFVKVVADNESFSRRITLIP